MRTATIEIDERFGEEYKGTYIFQEISWAKRNRIMQKHTKYHPLTGRVVSSDAVAIQAETIWAALKEQPASKPITLEKLLDEENGIPIELGEIFSKSVNDLCGITAQAQRFLSELYGEENLIQALSRSGSAKSSDGPQLSSTSSQPKQLKSSS